MINWKLRLKNKTTLVTLVTTIIAFVYSMLAIFEVVPAVGEETMISLAMMVVTVLAALGIVVDPTTNGIGDSELAMSYEEPKKN